VVILISGKSDSNQDNLPPLGQMFIKSKNFVFYLLYTLTPWCCVCIRVRITVIHVFCKELQHADNLVKGVKLSNYQDLAVNLKENLF